MKRNLLFSLFFTLSYMVVAQTGATAEGKPSSIPPVVTEEINTPVTNEPPSFSENINTPYYADPDFINTIVIAVIFLVVTIVIVFRKRTESLSGDEYVRLIGILLVVFSSLLIMSVGWSKEHAAPAFGILGTIAGFLLGRQSNNSGTS